MSKTPDTKYTTYSLHFADFDPALFADREAFLKIVAEKLADLRRAAIADNVTAALEMYEQRGAKAVRSSAGRTKKGVYYRIKDGDIDVGYFPKAPRGSDWRCLYSAAADTMDEMEGREEVALNAMLARVTKARENGRFPQDASVESIARHMLRLNAERDGIHDAICDMFEDAYDSQPFFAWLDGMERRYLSSVGELLKTGQGAPDQDGDGASDKGDI